MGVLVEKFSDEKGIRWPMAVSPFHVHLISLAKTDEEKAKVDALYTQLEQAGIEVLLDDRDARAGEKFADSDLIGLPIRLVVSSKTLEQNSVEWKERRSEESSMVTLENLIENIKQYA
jgi:prolyl-tRNA synthetase